MRRVVYGQKLYYHDPQNDDFTHHSAPLNKKVDKDFRYEHRNIFFRAGSFLLYYLVAFPVLWVYCKLRYGVKVRGKRICARSRAATFSTATIPTSWMWPLRSCLLPFRSAA